MAEVAAEDSEVVVMEAIAAVEGVSVEVVVVAVEVVVAVVGDSPHEVAVVAVVVAEVLNIHSLNCTLVGELINCLSVSVSLLKQTLLGPLSVMLRMYI